MEKLKDQGKTRRLGTKKINFFAPPPCVPVRAESGNFVKVDL